jgi:hypothetical protein
MLNRVPPGLFREDAKIGAPDVNELLPAALQIASNNKNRITAQFNAEWKTGRLHRLSSAAPVSPSRLTLAK